MIIKSFIYSAICCGLYNVSLSASEKNQGNNFSLPPLAQPGSSSGKNTPTTSSSEPNTNRISPTTSFNGSPLPPRSVEVAPRRASGSRPESSTDIQSNTSFRTTTHLSIRTGSSSTSSSQKSTPTSTTESQSPLNSSPTQNVSRRSSGSLKDAVVQLNQEKVELTIQIKALQQEVADFKSRSRSSSGSGSPRLPVLQRVATPPTLMPTSVILTRTLSGSDLHNKTNAEKQAMLIAQIHKFNNDRSPQTPESSSTTLSGGINNQKIPSPRTPTTPTRLEGINMSELPSAVAILITSQQTTIADLQKKLQDLTFFYTEKFKDLEKNVEKMGTAQHTKQQSANTEKKVDADDDVVVV